MCAIIQANDHIRAICDLQLNTFFRRQLELPGGSIGLKIDAFGSHIAEFGILANQGISLKPARVGDDRAFPVTHFMQTTQGLDRAAARFLHQVECIHHHSLNVGILEILAVDTSHQAKGGIRQVNRKG